MRYHIGSIGVLVLGLLFLGCGGSKNLTKLTMDERLTYAKKLFDDGNYLDAKTQFQILVLNNPGSRVVDMAQFYFAECYYNMKEYITAAAEYQKLINLYPRSTYIDDAQFKLAMSYFKLSPKPELDQKYTYRAIDEFQQLLEDFPQSEFAPEAAADLQKCREKLAKKEYKVGELYRKLAYYESAVISFDEILQKYYDTKYAEAALFWKAHCLYNSHKLKEAQESIQVLISKYPKSSFKQRAVEMAAAIDTQLQTQKSNESADGENANLLHDE